MKYRIIARIEDDSFNNEESEIMGYMVVDERGKTNIGTVDKIYRLYQQGKIEGAEFKRNNEVTLRNIDDSLIPIFNMSAFSNSSDVPVYMISERRGNSYVVINKASGESAILAGSRIIAGVLSGQYKIGNARVTNGGIDYRDSVVVLSTLKKNGSIGYSIMTPTGEIKNMSKKDVIEGLIERQGKKLLNAKIVDGKLKAKDGNLPVIDCDEIERKRRAEEEAKHKEGEEAKRKAEEEAKLKAEEEKHKINKEKYGRGICNPKRNYDICIKHTKEYDLWIKKDKDTVKVAVYTYMSGANIVIDNIKTWSDVENKVNVQNHINGVKNVLYQVKKREADCNITVTLATDNILNIFDSCFNGVRQRYYFKQITLTGEYKYRYHYNRNSGDTNNLYFYQWNQIINYKVELMESAFSGANIFFDNGINITCTKISHCGLKRVKILNYNKNERQIVIDNVEVSCDACYGLRNEYAAFIVTKNDFRNGTYKRGTFAKLKANYLLFDLHGGDIVRNMFAYSEIKEIGINSHINKICKHAFYGVKGLKEIVLKDIDVIDDRAFGDSSVVVVCIEDSVKSVHPEAFAYCNNLKVIYCSNEEILESLKKSKYMSKNVRLVKQGMIRECSWKGYNYTEYRGKFDGKDIKEDRVFLSCNSSNINIKNTCKRIRQSTIRGTKVRGSLQSTILYGVYWYDCVFKDEVILNTDIVKECTFYNCTFENGITLVGKTAGWLYENKTVKFYNCKFANIKLNVEEIYRDTIRRCEVDELILNAKQIHRSAIVDIKSNNIMVLSNVENYEPYAIFSKDINRLFVPEKFSDSLAKTIYTEGGVKKNYKDDVTITYSGDTNKGYIICLEKIEENGVLIGYKVMLNNGVIKKWRLEGIKKVEANNIAVFDMT